MEWREKLRELLEPYGSVAEIRDGTIFELVDEESGLYDRLAFVVPEPRGKWPLVLALVEAIKDLTDHDIPARNLFAFGFLPSFEGDVIILRFFDTKPGNGAIVGDVPGKLVEIAERNRVPFMRGDGEGIGLSRGFTEEDFRALVKLIEAVTFEWE